MSERRELYKKLIEAGVHFGHQASRWSPKMHQYIWGTKNKIHLIDVSQTAYQLERSAAFLKEVAAKGQQILWVGTKKSAQNVVRDVAQKLDMPYVDHRWVGGTLSNFSQVKKSVTRLLHDEDIIVKFEKYPFYTKKELNVIKKRVERARKVVGGITNLRWPIGAIILVDVTKEESALKEASAMNIPVVGLVDTNSDPSLVDFVIPSNDDSEKSIRCIAEFLADAVQAGVTQFHTEAAQREVSKKEDALKKAAQKVAPKVEISQTVTVEENPLESDIVAQTLLLNEDDETAEFEDVVESKKSKVAVKKSVLEKKDR
jgi:small subunit ribosomal protein S2